MVNDGFINVSEQSPLVNWWDLPPAVSKASFKDLFKYYKEAANLV